MKTRGMVALFFLCLALLRPAPARDNPQPFLPQARLTLEDVVAVALRHNPDLLATEQTLRATSYKPKQVKGDYWPRIGLGGDYIRGNFISVSGPAQTLLTSVFTTYLVELSGNVTLEDFGLRFARLGEARAQVAQAEAQYHDVRSKIIFNVAQAYFKVLEAKALKEVSQRLLEAAEKQLKLAEGFVRTGEKPKLELLKAEANHSDAQFNALKAANEYQNAVTRLNRAMGIQSPPDYELAENIPTGSFEPNLGDSKALALRTRPQLVLARAKVDEAKARLNQLRAQRWPSLIAKTGYGWVDSIFPPRSITWTLGLTLNWSLFDGNKLANQMWEAEYKVKGLEEEEEGIRLQVDGEVEEAYRSLTNAKERLRVAEKEVAQAEEAYRLAEARYRVGLTSQVELADARAGLSQAKAHQVQALSDFRISQAALKRAIGLEAP